MSQELSYVIFATAAGWMGILGSPGRLLRTTLPQPSAQQARQMLGSGVATATEDPLHFQDLAERFKAYFCGQQVAFPDRLDFLKASPFQCKVWETSRLISYGETRSYAWIAEQVKNPGAARAVGQAMGRNPLPIIVPCHRVVSSNGGLGGFTGGLGMKRWLLALEGIPGTR